MAARPFSQLRPVTAVSILFLFFGPHAFGASLKTEVVEAFNRFITGVEKRLETSFSGRAFLWSDEFPALRQQLLSGNVVAQPAQGNGIVSLKGGLIQDWKGAVFIPHVSLGDVLAVVQDYDRHGETYKPDIATAKVESRQENRFQVFMRIVKSKFMLTDVLNTQHDIEYFHLDPKRVYSRAYSKRINEVVSPGQAGEHELPIGQDRGFLWRMNGYWFFEERDNGVYVACESVTLTRDMPFGMTALFAPILRDLPGESLRKGLEQTRKGVISRRGLEMRPLP